jgi:F0F1-type ATP synthase beta subunit
MGDNDSPSNAGVVVAVRGSVVDVRFDGHVPTIYSLLRAGAQKQIVIEALAQRDAHHVRGIALTATQGLARGMAVEDTGGPLKAPVGKGISGMEVSGLMGQMPSHLGYQLTMGTEPLLSQDHRKTPAGIAINPPPALTARRSTL